MLNKKEIYRIAMEQSAIDMSCDAKDFQQKNNKVVISKESNDARKYLKFPQICNIASYGLCAVAAVGEEKYILPVQEYLNSYDTEYLFSTPNIYTLNDIFEPFHAKVCFMAEYFLPDGITVEPKTSYETKWLYPEDFKDLYKDEWSNALCKNRKELDKMGIAAYDEGKMIAFAACSADCENMWQIGVDVLENYRGKGLSTVLTARLKNKILELGKVPFYCAAWGNIRSVRNAISSGFKPAWVEISIEKTDFIEKAMKKISDDGI